MIITDKLNNYINNHGSNDINYNIALFLINNIGNIEAYNITELSKKCFVSQATVSRFIKKLGFEDYNSFKSECLNYMDEIKNKKIEESTNIESLNKELKLFKDKFNNIDIENIVLTLKKYNKIYISGLNYCYLMAQYFQMECFPLENITIKVIEDNEEIQNIEKDSLLIILTTTGNYFNINRIVKEYIKNSNCEKILISIRELDEKIKALFDKKYILNMDSNIKDSRYIMMVLIDNIIDRVKINNK